MINRIEVFANPTALHRAGLTLAPSGSVDVLAWLTAREIQVLRAVASGQSAKEIAKILGIAPRTVERHLDHVRLKTRTRNRAHMVAFGLDQGFILVNAD